MRFFQKMDKYGSDKWTYANCTDCRTALKTDINREWLDQFSVRWEELAKFCDDCTRRRCESIRSNVAVSSIAFEVKRQNK